MNAHRHTVKGAQQLLYHCLHSIKSPDSENIFGRSISTQDKQTSFQNLCDIHIQWDPVHGPLEERAD